MGMTADQTPNDVILASLQRRIAAMHLLWQRAVSDLTLEQVNHHERPGVLPIAFSLLHYVHGEDRNSARLFHDGITLWETRGWVDRVRPTVPNVARGLPVEEAERLRFGEIGAWRDYQGAVFSRTEAALSDLEPSRLDDILFETIPETMTGAFITLVAPPSGPIRLVDALEAFIYQHGIRHLGEIEHARALVGLGGMT